MLRTVVDSFREGGGFMYVVLALGMLALAAAILHLVFARTWSLVIGASLLVTPFVIGLIGTQAGLSKMREALQGVDPSQAAMLQAVGEQEAGVNWRFGAIASGAALLPFALGELRRRLKGSKTAA